MEEANASPRASVHCYSGSNPNHGAKNMVEAIHSLTHSERLAQCQAQAVRVLAQQSAMREVKDRLRREGKIKLSKVPLREIKAMATARVVEDAAYRARLIAEAGADCRSMDSGGVLWKASCAECSKRSRITNTARSGRATIRGKRPMSDERQQQRTEHCADCRTRPIASGNI